MTINSDILFKIIQKNELIADDIIVEFRSAHPKQEYSLADLFELVSAGHLTPWQANRLLAGHQNFRIGEYTILEPLNDDDLGSVYRGRTKQDANFRVRLVAKDLSQDQLDAYIQRAYAFQELKSRSLVPVKCIFQVDARFVVVSEFPSGQLLTQNGAASSLSKAVLESVTIDLTQAIDQLQSQGLIHGSIGDQTLYLDRQNRLRIDLPRELGGCAESQCEFASDVAALGWLACRLAQPNSDSPEELPREMTSRFLAMGASQTSPKWLGARRESSGEIGDEIDALVKPDVPRIDEIELDVAAESRKPATAKVSRIKELRTPDQPAFDQLVDSGSDSAKNSRSQTGTGQAPTQAVVAAKTPTAPTAAEIQIQVEPAKPKPKPSRGKPIETLRNPDKPDFDQVAQLDRPVTANHDLQVGALPVPEPVPDTTSGDPTAPPVVMKDENHINDSNGADPAHPMEETKSTLWIQAASALLFILVVILGFVLWQYWPPSESNQTTQANSSSGASSTSANSQVKESGSVKTVSMFSANTSDADPEASNTDESSTGQPSKISDDAATGQNPDSSPAGPNSNVTQQNPSESGQPEAKSSDPAKSDTAAQTPPQAKQQDDQSASPQDAPEKVTPLLLIGNKDNSKKSDPAQGKAQSPAKKNSSKGKGQTASGKSPGPQPKSGFPDPMVSVPRATSLPAIEPKSVEQQTSQRLFPFKLPANIPLSVTLHGGISASASKINFDLRTSTSEDRTWIVMAGPDGQQKNVAKFFVKDEQFQFLWDRHATELIGLRDLQNCALKLRAADFQKTVVLRKPVVATELSFEKSLNATTQIKIEDLPTLSNVIVKLLPPGKSFPAHSFAGGKKQLSGRVDSITALFKVDNIEVLKMEISSRVTSSGVSIRAVTSYVAPDKQFEKLTSLRRLEESVRKLVDQADYTIQEYEAYVAKAPKDARARANYFKSKAFRDRLSLANIAKSYKKHSGLALNIARKIDGNKLIPRVYFQAEEMQVDLAVGNGFPSRSPQPAKANKPKGK